MNRLKLSKNRKLNRERTDYAKRNLRLSNATELINQRNLSERAGALEVKNRAKAVEKLNDVAKAFPTDPAVLERVGSSRAHFINSNR